MGFFREQEKRLAMRIIAWQYERNQAVPPPASELARLADGIVADAHRIARERGQNVLSIIKELVQDLRNK